MNELSLIKTIRLLSENRELSTKDKDIISRAREAARASGVNPLGSIILPAGETRTTLATPQSVGQVLPMMPYIGSRLVLAKAGATIITDVTGGELTLPVYNPAAAGWANLADADKASGGEFTEVTFTPKRITGYLDVSRLFLTQDGIQAESYLRQQLVDAVSVVLEFQSTHPHGVRRKLYEILS